MSDKQHAWSEEAPEPLTVADVDQIIEGIEEFIVSGDPAVADVWLPYIEKLTNQRAVIAAAPDLLEELRELAGLSDQSIDEWDPALLGSFRDAARRLVAKAEGTR